MAQRDDTISPQRDATVLAAQLEQLTALERALRRDTVQRPLLYTFVRGVQRLLNSYVATLQGATAPITSVAVIVLKNHNLHYTNSIKKTKQSNDTTYDNIVSDVNDQNITPNVHAAASRTTATVAWLIEQRVHWLSATPSLLELPTKQALTDYFSQNNPSKQSLHLIVRIPFTVGQGMSQGVGQHKVTSNTTPNTVSGWLVVFANAAVVLPSSQQHVLELAVNSLAHALSNQPNPISNPTSNPTSPNQTPSDLEAIPDCYLGIDYHGRIQQLNQRAADMLGRPAQDLYGHSLGKLLPHFRKALESTLEKATTSDRVHRLEVRSPHDGAWHELYIRATTQGFQLYSRDVSDRKAIEDTLKRERAEQSQLAEFRNKLIDFINQTLQLAPHDNWYQQFLEKALDVIPHAQAGSLVVRNKLEPNARFYYVAAVGYTLRDLQAITFSAADVHARAPNKPTVVRTWEQFPRAFDPSENLTYQVTGNLDLDSKLEQIAATLCVPVYAEPQLSQPMANHPDESNSNKSRLLVAMLFIDNYKNSDIFDDSILELASAVASQMGVLLQRFELERTVRNSEQRYRYIADVIAEIIYVYRRTEDGNFVREWGNWENEQRLTGYHHEEIDAMGGWSNIVHPDDINVHFLQKTRVRRGESSVTEYRIITKSGEERWIRDFSKVLLDEHGTVVAQYGANQDITEQKRFEQEREALLELNKKQRQIAEAQLAELKELHAANNRVTAVLRNNEARYKKIAEENIHLLAIEKAQRHDLEARLNDLAALNNLNRVVATATDLDSTLTTITEQVAKLFQATSCGIALRREGEDTLEIVAEHATYPSLVSSLGARISIADNAVNYDAIYQGQATIIHHAQTNPLHQQAQALMRERNIHTVMLAPLRARDNIFGTIGVDSNDPERDFSDQELRLLETVAGNVAGLIMSARLYSMQREQFETLKKLKGQLERKNRELVYLSMRDALTGLYNRRHFDQVLVKAFTTSQRYPEQPLSVVICDIDNFKKINDTFSHTIGDDVLRTVATLMLRSVRNVDTVARYGGEEFALVLPQTPLENAKYVCERIRKDIADYPWQDIQDGMTVTLSMGICADTSVSDHEKMLNIADRHLYRAKHGGKNQVCF